MSFRLLQLLDSKAPFRTRDTREKKEIYESTNDEYLQVNSQIQKKNARHLLVFNICRIFIETFLGKCTKKYFLFTHNQRDLFILMKTHRTVNLYCCYTKEFASF